MRAGGHLWLGVWSRQWRTAAARTLPGLPAAGIPLAPECVGGGARRGQGGAEPCRAAPKELSVQWEDREVGSILCPGDRGGAHSQSSDPSGKRGWAVRGLRRGRPVHRRASGPR